MLLGVVGSLGEAGDYPGDLDQLAANLRLFDVDPAGAARLAAARATEPAEAWVEQVMQWAWTQIEIGGTR